jgi:SAM-dependent methyltransferase
VPHRSEKTGWISIKFSNGKFLIQKRPFPSGIMPHGEKGLQMIERWDRDYRNLKRPPWDTGIPDNELLEAVENGDVRRGRAVVLGCGSGTNAIYLAERGFEVTGLDISPTALGIAEKRAQEAGVKVNWVLADVLLPPILEPFDLIFDRGCYHYVRWIDAEGFAESVRRLSHPGTRFMLHSINLDGPPGVRETEIRKDFSPMWEFEWLRKSFIQSGSDASVIKPSWSVMMRRR